MDVGAAVCLGRQVCSGVFSLLKPASGLPSSCAAGVWCVPSRSQTPVKGSGVRRWWSVTVSPAFTREAEGEEAAGGAAEGHSASGPSPGWHSGTGSEPGSRVGIENVEAEVTTVTEVARWPLNSDLLLWASCLGILSCCASAAPSVRGSRSGQALSTGPSLKNVGFFSVLKSRKRILNSWQSVPLTLDGSER